MDILNAEKNQFPPKKYHYVDKPNEDIVSLMAKKLFGEGYMTMSSEIPKGIISVNAEPFPETSTGYFARPIRGDIPGAYRGTGFTLEDTIDIPIVKPLADEHYPRKTVEAIPIEYVEAIPEYPNKKIKIVNARNFGGKMKTRRMKTRKMKTRKMKTRKMKTRKRL